MASRKYLNLFTIPVLICAVTSRLTKFPAYFQFGSASSSHQIEGAWNIDGKSPNIWDNLTHAHPELVEDRSNADIACDSYNQYAIDVQLLVNAGVDFYRFSISWSRIMPNGDVSLLNEPGLQYYDNLIDELLANDIEPMVTMFHWDLPQRLQDIGGMLNPAVIEYFQQYADVLFGRYGDRVRTWITFNEPWIICNLGYGSGTMAPLVRSPGIGNYRCSHHLLLANALIYDLYERRYRWQQGGRVGITINFFYAWPMDGDSIADVAAAERYMEFMMGQYLHPILSTTGDYPAVMRQFIGRRSRREGRRTSRLPTMTNTVRNLIRGKADFIGVNYYTSYMVSAAKRIDARPSFEGDQEVETSVDPRWPRAKSEWLFSVPEGLSGSLNWLRKKYKNPVAIITENGWSDEGQLNDTGRIEYYRGHLQATLDAINDGCNVQGHTSWSIMDNFEWLNGYTARFGIHHVNFDVPERTRTPKTSVKYLRRIYKTRTIPPSRIGSK